MQSNKTVLIFLIKFFGTYIALFLIYSAYLNTTQGINFSCDPITESVSKQTVELLMKIGYDAEIEPLTSESAMQLKLNNTPISRITEGCNAISVIILFISFIVAFAGSFKATFLYVLFGTAIIYIANILRIAIISISFYKYPAYQDILHDYIFPGIIYGITFLLWFIWIRKYSKHRQ